MELLIFHFLSYNQRGPSGAAVWKRGQHHITAQRETRKGLGSSGRWISLFFPPPQIGFLFWCSVELYAISLLFGLRICGWNSCIIFITNLYEPSIPKKITRYFFPYSQANAPSPNKILCKIIWIKIIVRIIWGEHLPIMASIAIFF